MKANLVLHCGGYRVDREDIGKIATPPVSDTHFPVNHEWLVQRVEDALAATNMKVVEQAHALNREGQDYFGTFQVERIGAEGNPDYAYVLGVRNSHGRRFAAGAVCGTQVFVCDNLAFNGEVQFARKHSKFIERDLPGLAVRTMGLLAEKWTANDQRFEAYKAREMSDSEMHDLLVRSMDLGAITPTQLPHILKEYRAPRHPEFAEGPRNLWRFFNSCTEIGKECGPFLLPKRTINLHTVCDGFAGLHFATKDSIVADAVDAEVINNL